MRLARKVRVALILLLVLPPLAIMVGTLIREIPIAIMTRDLRSDPNFIGFQKLPRGLIAWGLAETAAVEETSLDAETLQFLNDHNAMQARIAKVAIVGESLWMGLSKDAPWPLRLEMDRPAETMQVQGKGQKCVLKGRTTFAYCDDDYYGSMHTNLLYMAMFWTFDPRAFDSAAEQELTRQDPNGATRTLSVKVASAREGELYFDRPTGHLVRMKGDMKGAGTIQVDMYEFVSIDQSHDVVLPTVVMVKVPDIVFGMPLPTRFERVIQLRFTPKDIHLEYAPDGSPLTGEYRRALPVLGEQIAQVSDGISRKTSSLVLLSLFGGVHRDLLPVGDTAARLR